MTTPQDKHYQEILALIKTGITKPSSKLGQMIQVAGMTVSQQLAEALRGQLDSQLKEAYTIARKPGISAENAAKPPRPGMR